MSPLTDQLTKKWRQQGVTADLVLRMSICMVTPFVAAQRDVVFLNAAGSPGLVFSSPTPVCARFSLV
jgi:hypothetical protein